MLRREVRQQYQRLPLQVKMQTIYINIQKTREQGLQHRCGNRWPIELLNDNFFFFVLKVALWGASDAEIHYFFFFFCGRR
ncbi:hypothetical protein TRSC58_07321 [Trypanosoma rangeli SC58]|uniref:Uncharacterized protein n=1 Tax=Trypanosoma rangeli SC58 TaxID=429131 RepID=A0A061ITK0_TRYRA|nr:hypothetical protein TRSC58_07321 [Trypanosoma rangeli SC58]